MNKSQREYLQSAVNLLGTKEVKRRELETLSTSINIPVPLNILKSCPGSKKGYYDLSKVQLLLNPTTLSLDVLTTPTFEGIVETISEEQETEPIEEQDPVDLTEPTEEKKNKQQEVELFYKSKDEIDNPCYVVLNENQAIIWGVSYDIKKAYEIARFKCLHDHPHLTIKEAESLLLKNNFVRLWSLQCLNIICTISKVQLEI